MSIPDSASFWWDGTVVPRFGLSGTIVLWVGITRTVVLTAVVDRTLVSIPFFVRTVVLCSISLGASCLRTTLNLHMLSNTLQLWHAWRYHQWSAFSLGAFTASPSVSWILPSRWATVLASEVSPAALEKYFSCLNLGLQCPDDEDECDQSWPLSLLFQNLPSFLGSYVFDVDPSGNDESVVLSSSGSVRVGFARL